ncbi:hypothetical protein LGW09_03580 [Streptococcus mutans]|nr:hypothetical protein [Streptococcus mutans]
MFRYTSSIDGKKQEFPNRDALLLGLESEENRCLQMNISTQLTLEQVDQDGNVLDQAQLLFPMEEGESYQDALAEFGQTPASRKTLPGIGLAVPNFSKNKNSETANAFSQLSQKLTLLLNILKGMVLLFSLILAGLSFMVSLKLDQTVKTLKAQPRQIKQVQTTQISDEHAVDVFSRYFLAAYFNQRDGLKNFVASDIEIDQLKTDVKTANSVLLEQIKQTKGTYTMTYVCGLKGDDGKVSTKRVTFMLKRNKSSDYGYQVITAPKLNAYPN